MGRARNAGGAGRRPAAATVGALAACLILGGALPARANDPASRATAASVLEQVRRVLELATSLGRASVADLPLDALGLACEPVAAAIRECGESAIEPCRRVLAGVYGAARSRGAAAGALSSWAWEELASEAADAALRLAGVRAAGEAGACGRASPPGTVAAGIALVDRGRGLRLRPETALRGGRRWALVVEGLSPARRRAWREALWPRAREGGGLAWPKGLAAARVEGVLDGVTGARTEEGRRLARNLDRGAAGAAGLPGLAGVEVPAEPALSPAEFLALRAWFVPAARASSDAVVARFRTVDAREPLLRLRRELAQDPCSGRAARASEASAPRLRAAAAVVGVAAVSRRMERGESRPSRLRVWLALPRGWDVGTPLVVLVHGHGGSGRRVLRVHGDDLLRRGLAVAAFDLPLHGSRRREGAAFLEPLDPAAVAARLRQAGADATAVVETALRCGWPVQGRRRYRPREVRLLGYSLGAMVGAMVRSAEPALGATALLAGGGDIFGWLLLRVASSLGVPYVTCLGGPDHGSSCFGTGRCARPGFCARDPRLLALARELSLPYALAMTGADPVDFATQRTGAASHAPLLLVTGGEDAALHPDLATRLADAYGMRARGGHVRRGPHSLLVQWPRLDHALRESPGVREEVAEFLASGGRRLLLPSRARRRVDSEPEAR